jgi:hypothetical protein
MHSKASLVLGIAIMAVSAAAVVMALDWPWKAKLFPLIIGIPVFCLAAAEVAWGLLDPAARSQAMEFTLSGEAGAGHTGRKTLVAIAWMSGFFAAIVLLGFPIAVPLFVFLYAKLQGREGWGTSLGLSAAVWAFFYGIFDRLLHVPIPAGWIQQWVGLA